VTDSERFAARRLAASVFNMRTHSSKRREHSPGCKEHLASGESPHTMRLMFITTTFSFEGYRIAEYKGLVRGIIVRSPTIAQGIMGGLKNIIGGRIGAFTEMCEQARQQA